MTQLLLWVVVIIGPTQTVPLHHYRPVVWSTEAKCRAELARTLEAQEFVSNDPAYYLDCITVPDLRGEPA